MTDQPASPGLRRGRLSTLAAAMVVARRDFAAILLSRSFLFFLLGPLFPVIVAAVAGGVGQRVDASADRPVLGIAMAPADAERLVAARAALVTATDVGLPELRILAAPLKTSDPAAEQLVREGVSAVVSGTPAAPVLTGPQRWLDAFAGPVALLSAQAEGEGPRAYPRVALAPIAADPRGDRAGLLRTAQGAQTLLFLLTMLLAGMVLSNLVEEKGNKIIEVLAAAIPMDAVFFGKLFAMLGISFVGIAVWGSVGGVLVASSGSALDNLPTPAVGWPVLFALGIAYFAMAYLLLGSVFLAIGSMATTVREVQTLSMPVTMLQLINFFLASFAMTQPGSRLEIAAIVIPFSSPFAMLARAAQNPAIGPHVLALAWQAVCVVVFVRLGARLFRKRVMKSGPATPRASRWSRWKSRSRPARAAAS